MSTTVSIPADIDREDRVLFGFTVRQVFLLLPIVLVLITAWKFLVGVVPLVFLVLGSVPFVVIGVLFAVGKRDGVGFDTLAKAAIVQPRQPVAAGEDEAVSKNRKLVRLLGLKLGALGRFSRASGPVEKLDETGVIECDGRFSVALEVGFVNFDLRSDEEQTILVSALSKLLNCGTCHLQFIVDTRPVVMDPYLDQLRQKIELLPGGAIQEAATDHHGFVSDLVRGKALLQRTITVVINADNRDDISYGADHVETFANSIGVKAHQLTASALEGHIRLGVDPFGTPTGFETGDQS